MQIVFFTFGLVRQNLFEFNSEIKLTKGFCCDNPIFCQNYCLFCVVTILIMLLSASPKIHITNNLEQEVILRHS